MYGLLIPDAMQRLIDETPGFPLTITSNNPELPWELMHDGRQFLCLERMFARMPTGQTFPRRSRDTGAPPGTQKRALLISSGSNRDLPEAIEEIAEIEDALKTMGPQMSVTTVTGADVTSSRLTDELSLGNYDIVHYAGHAGFDPATPSLSFLLLPNGERFRAERVQRLLEGHPIVFLNACESSKTAPKTLGGSTGSTLAQSQGLAEAFVYGGAQACVGSLWPVFDDTARAFAREFYGRLVEKSERVGEALRLARLECRDQHKDKVTWAAYALYGDPAYRLGAAPTTTWTTSP
jgi:CHAT domain-containing protein